MFRCAIVIQDMLARDNGNCNDNAQRICHCNVDFMREDNKNGIGTGNRITSICIYVFIHIIL